MPYTQSHMAFTARSDKKPRGQKPSRNKCHIFFAVYHQIKGAGMKNMASKNYILKGWSQKLFMVQIPIPSIDNCS